MEFGADPLKNMLTRAQNSENPNPHTSKIAYLPPVYGFRNTRRRIHHISDPRVKFGQIRTRYGRNRSTVQESKNRIRNLHMSKIRFLHPVHSSLNTKLALLNFICIWDLVLIC